MRKLIILAVLVSSLNCMQVYGHTAKKEIQKDDVMLEIQKQVKELILKKNDYDAALKLYAEQARKNTHETYYRDQYSILRRVIKMKRAMQEISGNPAEISETELKKWESYYQAVRAYYYSQGFYEESPDLDNKAVEILKSDQAKLNYIETLVVLDKNEEAKKVIEQTAGKIDLPAFNTLALLVQARMTPSDSITKQLEDIQIGLKDNPLCLVYFACIYQIQGDINEAYKKIVKALENTSPTQITTTRKMIETLKEFHDLSEDKKFQAALQTQSKVYQSGCTGGSSCNSCSLKDTCPSNQ